MEFQESIQPEPVEYLGVMKADLLELKIYRCILSGSICENGLLVRQTEYLIKQLPSFSRNVRQGYIIMLRGIKLNHFRIGLFNERTRKIVSHCYSIPCKNKFEFHASKIEGEVFFKCSELKELIDYESSLIRYIKRKGYYNVHHF